MYEKNDFLFRSVIKNHYQKMSLIDYLYDVFPEYIVFQILTYKRHPCADMIKQDYFIYVKNTYFRQYEYSDIFNIMRICQKKQNKANNIKKHIKDMNKKIYDFVNRKLKLNTDCNN